MKDICYFDNAATTWPKPQGVIERALSCLSDYCGNPGRGSNRMAMAAAEEVYLARELICDAFSAPYPDRVVFTLNATYALNMAIEGIVPDNCHVLISDMEHNSVLRPVERARKERGVEYSVFSTEGDVPENIRRMIKKNTAAVICIHASNVSNCVLPIERIGRMLSARGVRFIVDASQSAGNHRIDMERACIDALCMPGHKGLLGPQGVGIAVFSQNVSPRSLVTGGSGALSRLLTMPDTLPEALEAGTVPTPCIAGLVAGMRYVKENGAVSIRRHEGAVIDRVRAAFEGDGRIITYSKGRGPVWLFNVRGISPQRVAQLLDREGICVRAGLHCAPLAHNTLATPEDGAVRVSAGPFNTIMDADRLASALEKIINQ